MEAAQVQVTGVKLDRTETGLDIVLETAEGKPLTIDATKFRREGNNLIAEIPNATLALPQGQTFVAENPTADIATVQVEQAGGTIRVSVAGNNALPKTEVTLKTGGLAYSLNPEGDEADDELVVTGAGRGAYRVPNASTATRTDTPIRDIPQSIQVVPQQVLRDRNVNTLTEAVETVSGVVDGSDYFGAPTGARIIRGFSQSGNFRNGFRDADFFTLTGLGTIDRVEVLKGPASVLFGAVEPGGIINVVTKQPLSEPFHELAFEAGNRAFIQPSIDFSGPLNDNKTILYRLIASYQRSDGFQDFVNTNLTTIAPTLTFKLGDQTDLNLYYEYIDFDGIPEQYTSILSDNSFLPRSFYQGYPGYTFADITTQKIGYTLNHRFSDSLQIRNSFSVSANKVRERYTLALDVVDDRFLPQIAQDREYSQDNYFGQIDLLGKFNTGSISHQVLIGFDFNRNVENFESNRSRIPALDVLNPNYNIPRPNYVPGRSFDELTESYGVYIQDQIALLDNLKLLIGGRFDWVSQTPDTSTLNPLTQNDFAFSPRIGLVYQPSRSISLYASYSRSFIPTFEFNADDQPFEPTKGTQYEAGIKVDFLNGKLSTTLAAYQITKANVTTPNPDPELAALGFSIQTGEQRSRGLELDIAGEISPGWRVIGSYAYTDARVTEDNTIPVGNRLVNVPENQASLWTTYEIQNGSLKGLGFGLGLFYVSERQGDLDNSFTIPSYLRTDASVFYRRGQFNAAINIRNLFDADYIRASEASRTFLRRGAPFTITGSIRWEF